MPISRLACPESPKSKKGEFNRRELIVSIFCHSPPQFLILIPRLTCHPKKKTFTQVKWRLIYHFAIFVVATVSFWIFHYSIGPFAAAPSSSSSSSPSSSSMLFESNLRFQCEHFTHNFRNTEQISEGPQAVWMFQWEWWDVIFECGCVLGSNEQKNRSMFGRGMREREEVEIL